MSAEEKSIHLTGWQHRKIGEILVDMGAVAPAELDLILSRQQPGERFGEVAVRDGIVNDELIAQALATQFHLEYVDLDVVGFDAELFTALPVGMAQRYCFLPLSRSEDGFVLAITDPTAVADLDRIEMLLEAPLVLRVAGNNKLIKALERGETGARRVLQEVSEDFKLQLVKETEKGEEVLSIEKLTEDTSPIIRLIDSTLYDALNRRASDIHIESSADGVVIKYRVDGVLFRASEPLDGRFQSPIISRIKVMSELDISERRIPQDGRFKVRIGEKSIDFRVSIMPSIFGEDAVIRILDKESIAADLKGLTLDVLGINERERGRLRKMIREPYGMVLVTGPT